MPLNVAKGFLYLDNLRKGKENKIHHARSQATQASTTERLINLEVNLNFEVIQLE